MNLRWPTRSQCCSPASNQEPSTFWTVFTRYNKVAKYPKKTLEKDDKQDPNIGLQHPIKAPLGRNSSGLEMASLMILRSNTHTLTCIMWKIMMVIITLILWAYSHPVRVSWGWPWRKCWNHIVTWYIYFHIKIQGFCKPENNSYSYFYLDFPWSSIEEDHKSDLVVQTCPPYSSHFETGTPVLYFTSITMGSKPLFTC